MSLLLSQIFPPVSAVAAGTMAAATGSGTATATNRASVVETGGPYHWRTIESVWVDSKPAVTSSGRGVMSPARGSARARLRLTSSARGGLRPSCARASANTNTRELDTRLILLLEQL